MKCGGFKLRNANVSTKVSGLTIRECLTHLQKSALGQRWPGQAPRDGPRQAQTGFLTQSGPQRSPIRPARDCYQVAVTQPCLLPCGDAQRDVLLERSSDRKQIRISRGACGNSLPEMENVNESGNAAEAGGPSSSSRQESSRPKLGRLNSRGWFNKSFDQAALRQTSSAAPAVKTMKRQNSVTDFFQHVLSKSKSQIQDLFSAKLRERSKKRSTFQGNEGAPRDEVVRAEGGQETSSDDQRLWFPILHNSCPSFKCDGDVVSEHHIAHPVISFDPDPSACARERRLSSQSSRSGSSLDFQCQDAAVGFEHRPIVKTPISALEPSSSRRSASSFSPSRQRYLHFSSVSPVPNRGLKIPAPACSDFSGREGYVSTSEEMTGRASVCSASPAFLSTEEGTSSRSKRALVKSNSDTFAKLASPPQYLAKASSDGDCFKRSPASSLAASMTSLGSIMCGITDYLFLGSVEAAYNEPLLCKYGITSLVDMSNVSPSAIPTLKKSDCPCACANKTHFRSKLNIGVDDIEWENVEQYFDDINAFIHGARKMKRRVLVFSYLGQSRAPAAVIQHLMQHFRMPFKGALSIVRAKRSQVKLNSGFVKALVRLEKRLGLQSAVPEQVPDDTTPQSSSPASDSESSSAVEVLDALSVPPVVKGAWLDC
ncbi:hypothetical protein Btru_061835 [Bulinus truncatus]|nr:hypothetical protein Btru_061835 [Bulinus truncatus]